MKYCSGSIPFHSMKYCSGSILSRLIFYIRVTEHIPEIDFAYNVYLVIDHVFASSFSEPSFLNLIPFTLNPLFIPPKLTIAHQWVTMYINVHEAVKHGFHEFIF